MIRKTVSLIDEETSMTTPNQTPDEPAEEKTADPGKRPEEPSDEPALKLYRRTPGARRDVPNGR
jgi:hypothetical protein